MVKRLLVFVVVGLVFLAACARPPVAGLEETRRVVAYAYASGASRLATDVYSLAAEALRTAEQQVRSGAYPAAEASLELARAYSKKALSLTVQKKQQFVLERERLAQARHSAEKKLRVELLRKQQAETAHKKKAKKKALPSPVKTEPEAPKRVVQVEVAPAENLMMIAARPEVYNDALLWPLIYKANRDQIKDPKEVFSGQILLIPRDKSPEEVEAARTEAEELKLF